MTVSFAAVVADLADTPRLSGTFDPAMTDGLPAPAARMLRHALSPGTPLAAAARLDLTGSVVQGGRRLVLSARELLVPSRGFAWDARASWGPLHVAVRDHYLAGEGKVAVRLLGLVPLGGERGPDTAASARGRLAGESLWVPSMLLPSAGAQWSAIDECRAQVHLQIDGEGEAVTLTVAPDGRVTELAMMRWGTVGVDEPQRIPYGFQVSAETTFGGYTIASSVEGGWWYGTDRYQPEAASRFRVERARWF
ncbi:MAG: DUF6544 family protein [Jiangellales bacterium]